MRRPLTRLAAGMALGALVGLVRRRPGLTLHLDDRLDEGAGRSSTGFASGVDEQPSTRA